MAKRKLSPQQRLAIRKVIEQGLAQKRKISEILRGVAEKYEITTVTARWYLKSLRPGTTPRGRKASARRRPAGRRPGAKRRHLSNGVSFKLVEQVQSVARLTLKRALEAKKLIPKWQVYVKKEASLRRLVSRASHELKAITSKATALRKRIQALTPR
jgi:hypothetical protein